MYAIRGFTEAAWGGLLLGVPFSKVSAGGDFEYGEPLTTAEMFSRASASLDTALANATGANYRSLAPRQGARLLDQGQFAAAAAAVSAVPTIPAHAEHSIATARQTNGIWSAVFNAGARYTVARTKARTVSTTSSRGRSPCPGWPPEHRIRRQRQPAASVKYTSQSARCACRRHRGASHRGRSALAGRNAADRDAVFAALNTLRATGTRLLPCPAGGSPPHRRPRWTCCSRSAPTGCISPAIAW